MNSAHASIYSKLITRQRELCLKNGQIEFVKNGQDKEEANSLLNDLSHHPHAFVLACLMDRQQPLEKCWLIPHRIRQKIGSFQFETLARLSEREIINLMCGPPPLHRLKNEMGSIFYKGVQQIGSKYSGNAGLIWANTPSSATLVRRFLEFHGAGQKIATMAANILVRELSVPVSDKISIDVSVDRHVKRVFGRLGLVRKDAKSEEIIYTARELNPLYPGVLDLPLLELGRTWCSERGEPDCRMCYMRKLCTYANSRP
jgi:endonuclease III